MPLTLAQAAAETGLHRSSILRAIKAGRISGARDGADQWVVEPAELFRVFPPAAVRTGEGNGATRQAAQADAAALAEANLRAAGLVVEVGMLREQLGDARADRDRWREEAAGWRGQAERLALPKPAEPEQPLGWWAWLRSSG